MDRTHLGKGQLNPPDLTLVTETVLSGELSSEGKTSQSKLKKKW